MEKDIKGYEPTQALDGGKCGFSEIEKVVNKASILIKKNGRFVLEIGFDQKKKTLEILKNNGFFINRAVKDYGKNDRCIICTKL